MAYDLPRATTVLFGGLNTVVHGDTWEWNGTNWSQRAPAHSPSPRWGHALASWPSVGRIVLFGGRDVQVTSINDTWEYDGVDWIQRFPTNLPSPRHFVRMAFDPTSGSMLLFGGATSLLNFALGDTWRWNGTTWTQLQPPASPPARFMHGLVDDLVRGRVVLWGGYNFSFPGVGLTDTWIWNGSTWSQVTTPYAPTAGYDVGMAHDRTRDCVVVAGGTGTWLFDGAAWRRDPRPGTPSARMQTGMTYDFARGRTILFGGRDFLTSANLNDTWEYAPGDLARWTPLGSGCAGSAGVPVLRPSSTWLPVAGMPCVFEVVNLAATSSVAAISFGFSATTWNGQPLPMGLGGFGMPGCSLHASPDFLSVVPVAGGRAELIWQVPNYPGLIGTQFWNQAIVFEPGVNAAGAVVANAGAGVIGAF